MTHESTQTLNTQAACHTAQDITWMHAADKNTNCMQTTRHVDKRARGRANSRPHAHKTNRTWSASVQTPTQNRNSRHECRDPNTTLHTKQGTQTREHTALCNFSAYLHYESGIFNENCISTWKQSLKSLFTSIFSLLEKGFICMGQGPTFSHVFFYVVSYYPSFPIKMHATDAKTQKIEPDPNFFWRTKVSEPVSKREDTTWGRIYFLTCKNSDSVCRDLQILHAGAQIFTSRLFL